MRRAERFAGMVIAGSFVLSCACASKHPTAWTPKPRVQWNRVVPYPVPSDYNNYRILLSEPTRGLFPSSIAVTRVAVEAPAEVGVEPRVRLIRDPRNEFLMWNSTFDTHMAISEVFSIDERDMGGSEADPQQIISANKALGARIALVYAVNEITSTSCEMIGALFDTAIAEPIATFHVFADSPLTGEDDDEADLLDTHATALARSNFERVVRACVHELIRRDLPADVEPPRGWTPAGSMAPAVWPPRQFRTGR